MKQKSLALSALKGVGPKSLQRLNKLGIHSVADILFHLPLRYEDRTRVVPIGTLRMGDQAVIEGDVELAEVKIGRRRSLMVRLSDGTGFIMLRFFHFSNAQKNALIRGARLRCFGEVRNGPHSLELVHPEYRQIREGAEVQVEESLTPIYPTTEGMHQMSWRDLSQKALHRLDVQDDFLPDYLPVPILEQFQFPNLKNALFSIHRPSPEQSITQLQQGDTPAQQRLVFEELLAYQLSLRQLRRHHKQLQAPTLSGSGSLLEQFVSSLSFTLTDAQQRVAAEVSADLAMDRPMLRLVQGDVGSGKTVVAAIAALRAIESGYQVVLMVPTELLAEQHFRNFKAWLHALDIEPGFLTGRDKGARRRQLLADIAAGERQLIIGTHALFQDDVTFNRLGLIIIDEQHRFGVHQRLALKGKGLESGLVPHQLVMTATPIPRSLAMAAYADLDLSIIDELPPGRTPVVTVALPDHRRDAVIQRVEQACLNGRQAYWVCTLIDESEVLQCQAAEDTAAALTEALPGLNIGLVHGRMKAADKELMMARFKTAELHLLVATTVIEVGVDVPNASLMIIENPERLGLAQLHQLRGRVGRGSVESHCLLLYHAPLSQNARQRLDVMRETNDGFVVAKKDMDLRGPGEVLGTRQTGMANMRIADLVRDQSWIEEARRVADLMLVDYPDHIQPLINRWIGERLDYGQV